MLKNKSNKEEFTFDLISQNSNQFGDANNKDDSKGLQLRQPDRDC